MRALFALLFLLSGLGLVEAQSNTPANINGCIYLTQLPTLTNGQQSVFHCDSSGQLLVDDVTGVTSVSNGDGTITISPTTGDVIASLALGHANTWTGIQTFTTPVLGGGDRHVDYSEWSR